MFGRSQVWVLAFLVFSTSTFASIDGMPVTYGTLASQILGPRCVKCHCSQDSCDAGSVPFDSYLAIMNDPGQRWAAPGAQSRVVRALTRTDKFRMPPPSDSDPLSADEVNFIVNWIDLGKPE